MSNKGYVKLSTDPSSSDTFIHDTFQQQQTIIRDQDEDLERVGDSLHAIRQMTHRIGDELDEQSEMLDDLGSAMMNTETRMDNVMKKIAKISKLDDDNKQWTAIFVLIGLIFFLLFLLVVL
uniref:t-SNARE coiled-coil homology domain-containing protein n=1 Tax=Panagrellus redivivus TaxID=6233 RepID=A0A7E4VI46_PANRE